MSDFEEGEEDQHLFEKFGIEQKKGKNYNKGNEYINKPIKHQLLIEKNIEKSDSVINKKKKEKILNECKDYLNPDVFYSINKKNRWELDHLDLLKSIPSNCEGEIIERNMCTNRNNIFAVHSKIVKNEKDPEDFDIRSATTSSIKGQNYSNFIPKSRELGEKKKNKKEIEEIKEENGKNAETVKFNLYKSPNNSNYAGLQLFKSKTVGAKTKTRKNQEFENDLYEFYDEYEYPEEDDEEAEEKEEEEDNRQNLKSSNLSQFLIEKNHQKEKRKKEKELLNDFEILEIEKKFEKLVNVQEILHENGFTITNFKMNMEKNENEIFDWENEISLLFNKKNLNVFKISKNEVLIDASQWCYFEKIPNGEFTLFLIISNFENDQISITINSTIESSLGPEECLNFFSKSENLLDLVKNINNHFIGTERLNRNLKLFDEFLKTGKYTDEKLPEDIYRFFQIELPNRNDHKKMVNSCELTKEGKVQDWKDICDKIRGFYQKSNSSLTKKIDLNGKICEICKIENKTNNLMISNNEIKCRNCLKKEFEKELESKRFPIDLKISTSENVNNFDILPLFIPLPILNYYIRMFYQKEFESKEAEKEVEEGKTNGIFEKCPNCFSLLHFDQIDNYNLNVSCHCDYSWCLKCKSVPHWPMTCQQYQLWAQKWTLRYDLERAKGNGNDKLYRIICECTFSFFYIRTPSDPIYCSVCARQIEIEKMLAFFDETGFVYSIPRYRKDYLATGVKNYAITGDFPYHPFFLGVVPVSKIPIITKSVVKICATARTIRFNVSDDKRESNIENKNKFDDLCTAALYLAENVTAWMYISNQFDRKIRKKLEILMNQTQLFLSESTDHQKILQENNKKLSEMIQEVRIMIDQHKNDKIEETD